MGVGHVDGSAVPVASRRTAQSEFGCPVVVVAGAGTGKTALLVAALLAGFGLVVVGATKTMMTKKNPVLSALENLGIGFVGGVLSFLVGQFFESFIGS